MSILNDALERTEKLKDDYTNYLEWSLRVRSLINLGGFAEHIEAPGGRERDRALVCGIILETLCADLQRDTQLRALVQRSDAHGMWAALSARDARRRNDSTALDRIRALEDDLDAGLDSNDSRPLLELASGQRFARTKARPDWHTLEHLEAELRAVAVLRALSAERDGTDRAVKFVELLHEVSGPLDAQELERICKAVDDWHTMGSYHKRRLSSGNA